MNQITRTLVLIVVGILIVAIVLGTIFYLSKTFQGRTLTTNTGSLINLPIASSTGILPRTVQPSNQPTSVTNTKIFSGSGYILRYSNNWGLLTCNNSKNFELDPTNSQDFKNAICDFAVKPVTIISGNRLVCQGEAVTLGANKVIRNKTVEQSGDINYRWCVNVGTVGLDITHRVSSSGSRATSKDDFSAQIEQVISTLQTPTGS